MEPLKTCSELSSLSRKELEERILQLEAQNVQLNNALQNLSDKSVKPNKLIKKVKKSKPFNFSSHPKRHVLLKILYLGWNRQGFVVQDDTVNTVESVLFEALCKTKLIESRETSNYHRCGRTDKGVSAFSQVISITLRSKHKENDQLHLELDYSQILNRVLPLDVRVLAWSPVTEEFSARFDCVSRVYKYFFPLSSLNLELMNEAGKLLVGEHDFRNLCKMDVGNGVVTFKRKILSVDIRELVKNDINSFSTNKDYSFEKGYKMCVATIEGVAFLWHQIRSIMTILFLVGEGKEDPTIIEKLLDVKNCIRKPQYGFASEIGLNLYDAKYDNVRWHYDRENLRVTISQLQSLWAEHSTKESMLYSMLKDLSFCLQQNFSENFIPSDQHMFSHIDVKAKNYKPLMERPLCDSLEERVHYYVKRRKLDASILKRIEDCEEESEKTAGELS